MAKAKPFAGKESYSEELEEAKEVKSGKISPSKFARSEEKEERGMKKGGKVKRFAAGGKVAAEADGGQSIARVKRSSDVNKIGETDGPIDGAMKRSRGTKLATKGFGFRGVW